MSDLHLPTALVAGLVGCVGGASTPRLVRAVPEPDGAPDGSEPKVPYAAIADRPALALRCALAGGAASALMGAAVGWRWPLAVPLALVPVSLALAVIDWRTRLLPTWLIRPAYAATTVLIVSTWLLDGDVRDPAPLVRAAAGGAAAFAVFYALWRVSPRGMGFGDVRLSGLLGAVLAYLGWREWVVGTYAGFLLGAVVGGLLALLRVIDRRGYPFGPFMLAGALLGVLLGRPLLDLLR